MTHQIRYPKIINQEEGNVNWNNLDNIKLDDWQSLATCNITGKVAPNAFVVGGFDFNIPSEAKILQIAVFHDYHRDSSENPIAIEPPHFELTVGSKVLKTDSHLAADIHAAERVIVFRDDDLEGIDFEDINSSNFSLKVIFDENENSNEGILYLDYIRFRIDYEEKRYILSSGETNSNFPVKENPIKKAVGETFRYTLSFKNVNGVSRDPQKVQISIPDGVEVENYYYKSNKVNKVEGIEIEEVKDEFDIENGIWYPSVRGKGISRLRIVFKCVKEGTHVINAYNENTGLTPSFHVEIHDENYESPQCLFEETTNVWASELKDDEEYILLNQEVAIKAENVSMEFEMAGEKIDNLKEYVIRWIKRDIPPKSHFKALNNVSFTINKGERVGIIGFNGAGKSTLLKILAGVLKATEGKTHINGKVAPLLELGAGFDHNYNGRENLFLNGAILGYSKEFLESKYDEIIEFSELGEFIEIPLKNYSSGMIAKLGFSVATIVEPEILILDEILSVGDVKFQKKSGDKIKSMMRSGTTVLLVSHSVGKIRELCNRAIWLDHGTVVMDGDVDYVCDAYIEAASKASEEQLENLELD